MPEDLRVVIVGAASPQWGYGISRDVIVALSKPQIADRFKPVVVLEDVDGRNLAPQAELARKVAALAGRRVRIESTICQKQALDGARFVITTIAQGTLEAMQLDLEIPQEYSIYQPVGDTIGIGGAIRAARNIPAMLSIARDIERAGRPDAWLLNLSNPMSILCRAVTRETRVRTVGCCHELYGTLAFLAGVLDFKYEEWRRRVEVDILGINHCGWITRLRVDGGDGLKAFRRYLAKRGIRSETKRLYDSSCPDLARQNVKINLFLRHGVLPLSGDRHTAEFFAEFLNRDTNQGADYGVLLTSAQERMVGWRGGARAHVLEMLEGKKPVSLDVSQEAASRIITAVLLDRPFHDVGNLSYHGRELRGVPQGAVLERMATYDRRGARPDPARPLPPKLMAHLALHAGIIEDVVEASVTGNRRLLVEAMRRDLLLKNMDRRKIPELVDRLLRAHRRFVHPGFF